MKNMINKLTCIIFCFFLVIPMACEDDIDEEITELSTDRIFAPVGLEALVRNQIQLEINWQSEGNVDQYILEIYQDSLRFSGDPIETTVLEDFVPNGTVSYTATLDGDTRYSARVKALADGFADSKWATVTQATNAEQLFTSTIPLDIQGTSATVEWTAGSEVTSFFIQPGNAVVPISASQRAAGRATIEGLRGGTEYTVSLYNGTKLRGSIMFSTLKEANLTPLDDLGAFIDAAAEGDTLVLASGVYNLGSKEITKSITLEGQNILDLPIIEGQLTCATTVNSIAVRFVHFRPGGDQSQFFNVGASGCNLSNLTVEGSIISGYSNNIVYNNAGGSIGDISITDTYIDQIAGSGGDGFDFRSGTLSSLTVSNCTISNGVRTMLRMQIPADVIFSNVTFYRTAIVASSNNRGFFRMSGGSGSLEVSNCLFVETGVDDNGTLRGNWTRAGDLSEGVSTDFSDNYYFNVTGLFEGEFTNPAEVDATEADPGFEDPENGDFTITNQSLIDQEIGDSRWWN